MSLWKITYLYKQSAKELLAVGSVDKFAQFFRNYDYVDNSSGPGTSVYRDLTDGKVNSVLEWRRKKRKQRMKNIKKLLETRSK